MCDNAVLPAFAQAIFFIGAVVGGLLFGWIADRFGRIPSLMGCNLLGFVFGVATAFSYSFWTFSFCRFMLGFAFDNCFMMMYILGELSVCVCVGRCVKFMVRVVAVVVLPCV